MSVSSDFLADPLQAHPCTCKEGNNAVDDQPGVFCLLFSFTEAGGLLGTSKLWYSHRIDKQR